MGLGNKNLIKAAADKAGLTEAELRAGAKDGWVKVIYNSEHDTYSIRIGTGS